MVGWGFEILGSLIRTSWEMVSGTIMKGNLCGGLLLSPSMGVLGGLAF